MSEPLEVRSVVEERGHGLLLVPRDRSDLRDDALRKRDRTRRRRVTVATAVVARIVVAGCSQARRRMMAVRPPRGPYREGVVDG